MNVTFDNRYGTMPLEEKIRSIFDEHIAGQIDTNGNYYCIHVDHKTHKYYAMTRENERNAEKIGRTLEPEEIAIFNGEKVRGMTWREEEEWNMYGLMAHVDIWGNIAVDEPFDYEWYYEHCL